MEIGEENRKNREPVIESESEEEKSDSDWINECFKHNWGKN